MLLDKAALELLYRKCLAYIDEKISGIIGLHQNMVGGEYVRTFDRERMSETMGSTSLTVSKFREFLDWLAKIFGYYDKEIEDVKNDIDELDERIDNIEVPSEVKDLSKVDRIIITGIYGEGVKKVTELNGDPKVYIERDTVAYVTFVAIHNGIPFRYSSSGLNNGDIRNAKLVVDNIKPSASPYGAVYTPDTDYNYPTGVIIGTSPFGGGQGMMMGYCDTTAMRIQIYGENNPSAAFNGTKVVTRLNIGWGGTSDKMIAGYSYITWIVDEMPKPVEESKELTYEDGTKEATIKGNGSSISMCKGIGGIRMEWED